MFGTAATVEVVSAFEGLVFLLPWLRLYQGHALFNPVEFQLVVGWLPASLPFATWQGRAPVKTTPNSCAG
jgi:hypothetical protein